MCTMIFEKVEYSDGGPNDRGTLLGYIFADSKEEAVRILNVCHSFITVREISLEVYNKRKELAGKTSAMY